MARAGQAGRMSIPAGANGQRSPRGDAAVSGAEGSITYYNRPMIKRPTWKWFIPLYFFLGGLAGGAAVVGAAAEFLGGPKHRATVRHARYLTLGLAPVCAALLIADLGRPARFYRMLRVFKGSSPLNVGTYILTLFGAVSGVLAVRQVAEDGVVIRRESVLGRLARAVPSAPLTAAHGLLGLALGGYTGTLLAVTAVPLWAAGGTLLGPLFLATGLASGAAALRLVGTLNGTLTTEAGEDIADVEIVAELAQLGLVAAREVMVPARVGRPLVRGPWGILWRGGAVGGGMLGPLALNVAGRVAGPRARQTLGTIAAGLAVAGALAERFAITEAGKPSADDPLAYQAMTRGLPGKARPTAAEQAARASDEARRHPFQAHQVVPER